VVDLTRQGPVFILAMRSGENRFNRPFLDALVNALDEIEGSGGPTALVTVGEHKFYSNGLDLNWLMGEGAAIVLVSSVAGLRSGTRIPAYDASKAALAGLGRHVALEGSRMGVRANVVAPGLIDTPR